MSNPEEKEKDLIYKIQVLRGALLSEKKKTSQLETELKHVKKMNQDLETELDTKDKEIIKHTSEKHKLISTIDYHRHKSFVTTGVVSDFDHENYDVDVQGITESIIKKQKEEKELFNDDASDCNSDNKAIKSLAKDKEEDDHKEKSKLPINNNSTPVKNNGNESNDTKLDSNCNKDDNIENSKETVRDISIIDSQLKNDLKNVKTNKNVSNSMIDASYLANDTSNTFINSNFSRASISQKLNVLQNKFGNLIGNIFRPIEEKFNMSTTNNTNGNSNASNNNNRISPTSTPRSGNSIFKNKAQSFINNDNNLDSFSLNENSVNNDKQKSKEQTLIANYELVIHHLTKENQNQKNLLIESNKNIMNVKEEFQNLLSLQVEKIKSTQEELHIAREDLIKYTQSTQAAMNQNKSYEVKINNYESMIKNLKAELLACQNTIKKFQNMIEDKEMIVCSLQENLRTHEKENTILARKLAELKTAIMNENIRMQLFTGKKKEMFSSSNFNLVFTKDEEDGFLKVIYKEENGKVQEVLLLEDIENIKPNDSNDNAIDFSFYKNKKIVNWVLIMNENIHQVIRIYRDFRERSDKQKNMLYY